jgi:methyl-accepting chemotaxis protein
MIEFTPDGVILSANSGFLAVVEYQESEVVGKHHRMFCASETVNSPDYKTFWKSLAEGEKSSGQFKRLNKQGQEVWL